MKFNIKVLILSFFFILSPSQTYADENIEINCKQEKEITICQIKGKTDFQLSALEYGFSLSDDIEKVKFEIDESWQGDEENNLVLLYTDENKEGIFNIGTLYLKSNKEIKVEDIKTEKLIYYDSNFQQYTLKNVNKVEKSEKKDKTNNKILKSCVIISIGIIVLVLILVKIRKGVIK